MSSYQSLYSPNHFYHEYEIQDPRCNLSYINNITDTYKLQLIYEKPLFVMRDLGLLADYDKR